MTAGVAVLRVQKMAGRGAVAASASGFHQRAQASEEQWAEVADAAAAFEAQLRRTYVESGDRDVRALAESIGRIRAAADQRAGRTPPR